MKTKIVSLSKMALLLLGLSQFAILGCGVGVEGGDAFRAQQARDSKALQTRFDRVRGVYEGEVANPATGLKPQRARLSLYVMPVREGVNPDGTAKIRPGLYGRMELIDAVSETDLLTLSGDTDDFGKLTMTSISAAGAGASGAAGDSLVLTLDGQVVAGRADLNVGRRGGFWGLFSGQRVSQEATAPSVGEDVNYRNRLRKLYEQIEGVYEGIAVGGPERRMVAITLSVGQGPGVGGALVPILNGQFRYSDFPRGVGERQLRVKFDSPTGQISMDAIAGGGTIPGSQFLSAEGSWENGNLKVVIRDNRGLLGTLTAVRAPFQ